MALALDEPKENDNTYDIDGFSYIIDKEFLEKVESVKIDFQGFGFRLDCGIDPVSDASACSCKTSSCSC